jgi:hypothetical protein
MHTLLGVCPRFRSPSVRLFPLVPVILSIRTKSGKPGVCPRICCTTCHACTRDLPSRCRTPSRSHLQNHQYRYYWFSSRNRPGKPMHTVLGVCPQIRSRSVRLFPLGSRDPQHSDQEWRTQCLSPDPVVLPVTDEPGSVLDGSGWHCHFHCGLTALSQWPGPALEETAKSG